MLMGRGVFYLRHHLSLFVQGLYKTLRHWTISPSITDISFPFYKDSSVDAVQLIFSGGAVLLYRNH